MAKAICIISPSLKVGGIARILSELANHWAKTGYRVTFISCLAGNRHYRLDNSITLIEPTFSRTSTFFNKLLFYPRLIGFITKQVKNVNPDVVLSFGDTFNPLVLLALKSTNCRVFISDRTSPDYQFKFPTPLLKKIYYPSATGFIAQTSRAANYRNQEYGKKLKIHVIPNPIREVKDYQLSKEKIILYVGRFAWEKGPDRLIKAFSQISSDDDWALHMAGDGPMLGSMKKLAKELNIKNKVIFHGKVQDVDALYARASIFVLPSVLEGFPNALCEAMAFGLPCLCFDSIPYEDIFQDWKSGIAVKDGNLEMLAHKMGHLIDNPEERKKIGTNAKREIEKLQIENIAKKYISVLFS